MSHHICILTTIHRATSKINTAKANGKKISIVTGRSKVANNEQNMIPAKIRLTSDLLKPKYICNHLYNF